jgi:hypothetical protein
VSILETSQGGEKGAEARIGPEASGSHSIFSPSTATLRSSMARLKYSRARSVSPSNDRGVPKR